MKGGRWCKVRCDVVCEKKKKPAAVLKRVCNNVLPMCMVAKPCNKAMICGRKTERRCKTIAPQQIMIMEQNAQHAVKESMACEAQPRCCQTTTPSWSTKSEQGGSTASTASNRDDQAPACERHGCMGTSSCRAFARRCGCEACLQAICAREVALQEERDKKEEMKQEKKKKEQNENKCCHSSTYPLEHHHHHHHHHHNHGCRRHRDGGGQRQEWVCKCKCECRKVHRGAHHHHHHHGSGGCGCGYGCGCVNHACCTCAACARRRAEAAEEEKKKEQKKKEEEEKKKKEEEKKKKQKEKEAAIAAAAAAAALNMAANQAVCWDVCSPRAVACTRGCRGVCICFNQC